MFHNVLAQQGQSSFFDRARLNLQVFALCDMKMLSRRLKD